MPLNNIEPPCTVYVNRLTRRSGMVLLINAAVIELVLLRSNDDHNIMADDDKNIISDPNNPENRLQTTAKPFQMYVIMKYCITSYCMTR
jgi:hypothetical protein